MPNWHLSCFQYRYMRDTNKKILIVDNDAGCRQSLRCFMVNLGYQVFEAITGIEALDKAAAIRPDLIVMDLCLPGMKADETTKRLKASRFTRNIPVVISTAWSMGWNIGDRADRVLDAGAEQILYKPFHLSVLRDVLRSYLLA